MKKRIVFLILALSAHLVHGQSDSNIQRLEMEFEDLFDEKTQENKLIYALNDFVNVDQFSDSSGYDVRLNKLVFEMTETLQHDDITTFYRFKKVADSLDFSYEMKPSETSEYALFLFRYGNDKWNYVLKNREIVFKEEQVFQFFYEVHELNPNEFLLITLLNDMSYSCYEALVFNNLNDTTGTSCLSVCSWTNVDESYIDGRDSLTGEPVIIGRMASYDPIPIIYNSKTKSISYSFERLEDGKMITRKANYKNWKFIIESYNAQEEY